MTAPQPTDDLDKPFPLKSRFQRRFVPAFIGFVILFMGIVGYAAGRIVEAIYLQLAQERAQTIARGVEGQEDEAWHALLSGLTIDELARGDGAAALQAAFETEVRQLDLSELKVYDLTRRVLYATLAEEIGTTENGEALREAIATMRPGLVTKTLDDGTRQYELYVPVFDDTGSLGAVFELYEPVDYLDALLVDSSVRLVLVSAAMFAVFMLALHRLVSRAQADIDVRTGTINDLRRRIESLVSATAVEAAKRHGDGGGLGSERITTTLLFSDVRDFTGYSEQNTPEAVVDFLNRIMGVQVDIIQRRGGDIDKMIGDAVLARFDGDDGPARALAAAREIVDAVAAGDYPRALGIGIYRGPVVSGAIGPESRRDFTMIGDSVNIAARLCSEARADEIVVDANLAEDDFDPPEVIKVKGREQPLAIRRLRRKTRSA